MNQENYKDKVITFLNHPWQEDKEIEFINLIEENRENILTAPTDGITKYYLKRLWKENRERLLNWTSDRFVYELCLLVD